MNKSESITKIAPALLKAQQKMGNAIKDSKNPYFKSSYADLNSVREAVTPALHEAGISILQLTTYSSEGAAVETTLLHESGEYISSFTPIVSSKPNDPQAFGSAISYARRYGLSAMLSVGSADDDGEKAMDRTTVKSASTGSSTVSVNIATGTTNVNGAFGKTSSFRKNVTP